MYFVLAFVNKELQISCEKLTNKLISIDLKEKTDNHWPFPRMSTQPQRRTWWTPYHWVAQPKFDEIFKYLQFDQKILTSPVSSKSKVIFILPAISLTLWEWINISHSQQQQHSNSRHLESIFVSFKNTGAPSSTTAWITRVYWQILKFLEICNSL